MARVRNRFHLFSAILILAATSAPLRASFVDQGLPDIRGLNFATHDGDFHGVFTVGGILQTPIGEQPAETNPLRINEPFISIPHTFEVVAHPDFPNDPSRIQINTRWSVSDSVLMGAEGCLPFHWELRGTYDQITGEISVSENKLGTFLYDAVRTTNPFGLPLGDVDILIQAVNPSYSLHGMLTVAGDQLTITGTDVFVEPPPGSPNPSNNITLGDGGMVLITPGGDCDPTHALLAAPIIPGTAYGGLYDWAATVPEPTSLLLLGAPIVAACLKRRRMK